MPIYDVFQIPFKFLYREIRLPAVQKAVARHTRNSSKKNDAAEQSQQTAAKCSDKSAGAVAGMEIENLDVHVEIPKSEIKEARKAMRFQTAQRGKV